MAVQVLENGVSIAYDVYGDRPNPAIVGLQGLAEGRKFWPPVLVDALTEAGYFVVLLDNRDIGDSTVFDRAGRTDLMAVVSGQQDAPYTLCDMAADTVELMAALQIETAHLVGYSLGGMIAQWIALEYPQHVASLAPLMTTSGDPALPAGEVNAMAALMRLAEPTDDDHRDERIGQAWDAIQGSRQPNAQEKSGFVDLLVGTGYRPDAINRQLAAGFGTQPRHERLSEIRCPTTVLHGDDDPVFPVEHGRDLQTRIPGARLVSLPGAGHALTIDAVNHLTPVLRDHLRRATSRVVA